MTDPKDLLLVNEQLRRSNRRWKALALAACATLILVAIVGFVATTRQRILERERRVAAEARFAALNAAVAASRGQPR